MPELLLVLGGVVVLGGAAFMVATLAPLTLLWIAGGMSLVGMVLGVPAGLVYHVVLRRELLRVGPLPRGWLWRTTKLYQELAEDSQLRIWPWFIAGALGFLVSMLGAGLALLTLLTHFR